MRGRLIAPVANAFNFMSPIATEKLRNYQLPLPDKINDPFDLLTNAILPQGTG